MSNILRIRTLTDRFLEGETTLEEERELYVFYRSEEVPVFTTAVRWSGRDTVRNSIHHSQEKEG